MDNIVSVCISTTYPYKEQNLPFKVECDAYSFNNFGKYLFGLPSLKVAMVELTSTDREERCKPTRPETAC